MIFYPCCFSKAFKNILKTETQTPGKKAKYMCMSSNLTESWQKAVKKSHASLRKFGIFFQGL